MKLQGIGNVTHSYDIAGESLKLSQTASTRIVAAQTQSFQIPFIEKYVLIRTSNRGKRDDERRL